MTTDRLKLYNAALQHCKVRPIASLTVNEKARRSLDYVWNDGAIDFCLQQAQWVFARRASKLTPDTAIVPAFGYPHAFAKPTDWINTAAICSDEYFNQPWNGYADEGDFWFADIDILFVKYTSNDANYGLNLARWPAAFTAYVELYLASKVIGDLTGNDTLREAIVKRNGMLDQALLLARNKNQMGEPVRYPPAGSWVRARRGHGHGFGDGGSANKLIG